MKTESYINGLILKWNTEEKDKIVELKCTYFELSA